MLYLVSRVPSLFLTACIQEVEQSRAQKKLWALIKQSTSPAYCAQFQIRRILPGENLPILIIRGAQLLGQMYNAAGIHGHQQLLYHLFTPSSRRILEKRPEAKSEDPDWHFKIRIIIY